MNNDQFSIAITTRYDQLSGQECCLSCGGAFSLATIEEGFTGVDLGCGKGLDVLRMASLAGKTGFAYGVDISDKMMEVARQNAERLKISNVKFIKSPLEQIDLETGIADVIISNCTLNHSLDQATVWKEIARILKPGGSFVVSDIYAVEEIPGEYRNDPQAVSECWAGAVTRDQYLENISQAGLTSIEILEESAPYDKGKTRVSSFTVKGNKTL